METRPDPCLWTGKFEPLLLAAGASSPLNLVPFFLVWSYLYRVYGQTIQAKPADIKGTKEEKKIVYASSSSADCRFH